MSPFVTVGVLTVLWLIVVVPMVVRRNDELARDRSVRQFGRAMRALGRRSDVLAHPRRGEDGTSSVAENDVFIAGGRPPADDPALAVRRPVPAVQEALMHPVDRSEMSAARAAMMARRRRSLTVLGVGSLVTTLFALVAGGLVWLFALMFLAGLGGYLMFLRSQALKDRERRADRRERFASAPVHGYDVSEQPEHFVELDETVVRIDDDDIRLQTMDTIDLTGLYEELHDGLAEPLVERRAS
jgi:hypothetical protein